MTWPAAGDLLGPVPVELDLQLKLAAERPGTDRLAVAASALLEGYAWTLGLPLSAALATGAPAPDLAAANVRLRFDGGRPAEVALRDPAAPPGGGAGAVARLVDGHLGALVARLAERRVRRGPRALWGLVANGCAAALLEQARAAGLPPPPGSPRCSTSSSPPPGRSLPTPALLPVGHADDPRLVRRRVTCCLNYTVTGQPCATCPLLPPPRPAGAWPPGRRPPAASPGGGGGRRRPGPRRGRRRGSGRPGRRSGSGRRRCPRPGRRRHGRPGPGGRR